MKEVKAIALVKSQVVFKEEPHGYWLGGKQLKGITGIIERRLFPRKYDAVPAAVLNAAAERGTRIHKACEEVNNGGIVFDVPEAMAWYNLVQEKNLKPIAAEYTVSDGKHYASNIDCVLMVSESEVELVDYKTTYKLDREYLSWQLGIYKRFFEMQNPGISVKRCSAIWLRDGQAKYTAVDPKSAENVDALLQADINDEEFDYYAKHPAVPDYVADNLDELCSLNEQIKALQERAEAIKATIAEKMQADQIDSIITGRASFSWVKTRTQLSFDSTRFKKEHADLYKEFQKETEKKGYLQLKFKV